MMFWFSLLLALTIVLTLLLALIGRLIVVTFRIDLLRGGDPEDWLAAFIVGTGVTTLLSAWCSYCGFGATDHRWVILAAIASLLGTTCVRGRLHELLQFNSGGKWLLAIFILLAVRAGFYLAPLLSNGSHMLYSDALLYIPAADYLSQHGFGMAAPDVHQPVDQLIAAYHHLSHRMGPIFLHGLVTAYVPRLGAFELFPVLIALGAMQTLAAAYLVARWCFRVSRGPAVVGLALMTAVIHTLGVSATGGVFCQLYGTAILGLAVAVMSRLTEPDSWTTGNAVLAGSLVAFQMSMYSELLPVLALVALVWMVTTALRARFFLAQGQYARFVLLSVLAAVLVGNFEILRSWRGLQTMLSINVVGMHIDWLPYQYAEFAMGCNTHDYVFDRPLDGWRYALCAMTMSLLFGAGVWSWGHRQAIYPAAALAVFAGLFVFYSFFSNDPWTGQAGHSWNLFKICKWAYPFIAATQIAGVGILFALCKSNRLCQALLLSILIVTAMQHSTVNRRVSRSMAMDSSIPAGRESPYAASVRLRERLTTLDGPIHFVRVPSLQRNDALAVSLLYPFQLVNTWENAVHYGTPPLLSERPDAYAPNVTYLFFGLLPFQDPLECLPFQFARLDPTEPALVRVDFTKLVFVRGYHKVAPLNEIGLICWIFASRAGDAEMTVQFTEPVPPPGGDLIATADNSKSTSPAAPGSTTIPVSVHLQRGMNRVELKWTGAPGETNKIAVQWKNR